MDRLKPLILQALSRASKPLTMREIEHELWNLGEHNADTFDVRDVVSQLRESGAIVEREYLYFIAGREYAPEERSCKCGIPLFHKLSLETGRCSHCRENTGTILRCGDYKVDVGSNLLTLIPGSLGLSMVGTNDLYDLGFRDEELSKHGLRVITDESEITIKESP